MDIALLEGVKVIKVSNPRMQPGTMTSRAPGNLDHTLRGRRMEFPPEGARQGAINLTSSLHALQRLAPLPLHSPSTRAFHCANLPMPRGLEGSSHLSSVPCKPVCRGWTPSVPLCLKPQEAQWKERVKVNLFKMPLDSLPWVTVMGRECCQLSPFYRESHKIWFFLMPPLTESCDFTRISVVIQKKKNQNPNLSF